MPRLHPPRSLAAALVTLPCAAAASGDIVTSWYLHPFAYEYEVLHMPDFDQRRGPGAGAYALPNDGNYYCVPTSAADLLAYAADHGFPNTPPGHRNWQHQSNYNDAGMFIDDLGDIMGTTPSGGTGGDGMMDGINAMIGPGGQLTASIYYIDPGAYFLPGPAHMAQAGVLGGIVSFAYGRYEAVDVLGNMVLDDRVGGHQVVLAHAKYVNFDQQLGVRDPADSGVNTTQSTFKTKYYDVSSETVRFQCLDASCQVNVTALNWDPANDKMAVIDSYVVMKPMSGYTWKTSNDTFVITALTPQNFFGQILDPVQSWDLPIPAPPDDLVIAPDQSGWYVLQKGFLDFIDAATGKPVGPVDVPGGRAMVMGRKRNLLVVGDDTLMSFPTDRDELEPDAITFPLKPVDGIAYDDATDEVILVSSLGHALFAYPDEDITVNPHIHFIPDGVEIGFGASVAVAPAGLDMPRFWVGSPASSMIYGFGGTENGAFETINVPELGDITSLSFDDRGHLFVPNGEQVVELRRLDANEWIALSPDESYFGGAEVGPLFRVTCSRTNFDPALHGGPAWENIHPDDIEGGDVVEDCVGDFNRDGVVNVEDLLELLAAWGPCEICITDTNGDRVIDVTDLLELLAAWGACG
jgi:hypothetical protein